MTALVAVWLGGCSLPQKHTRCDHLARPDPNDPAVRTIQTRLVEHTAWRLSPGRDAEALVEKASGLWEEEFGIRFEIVARESVEALPMLLTKTAWHDAQRNRRFQGDEELILIFSRSAGLNPETAGILAGLVVIAPGPLDSSYHLLNHGLGHVFGLGHDPGAASFMSGMPLTATPGIASLLRTDFSAQSKRWIRMNKWCAFRPERPYHLRPTGEDEAVQTAAGTAPTQTEPPSKAVADSTKSSTDAAAQRLPRTPAPERRTTTGASTERRTRGS